MCSVIRFPLSPERGSLKTRLYDEAGTALIDGIRSPLSVHEGLQYQRRRHLIDQRFVLLAGLAGGVQYFVGCARGEALILVVHRKQGKFSQFGGKSLDFSSLIALLSGKMQRIADDNPDAVEAPAQPGQGLEVVLGISLAGQRQHRLRGQPKLV